MHPGTELIKNIEQKFEDSRPVILNQSGVPPEGDGGISRFMAGRGGARVV
jgi:hypothetical protein